MKLLLCALLLIVTTSAADAVVFRRDILTIQPLTASPLLIDDSAPIEELPPARESFQFYTDIRDENALRLDWVHSLNRINEERTMTILFDPPRYDQIMPQPVHQPLDIISVAPDGTIFQIAPNLNLSQLHAPIETNQRARARLIVQGGASELLGLRVGDVVRHPAFTPRPEVLSR
jgi:uncharacterized membrane protein (UPF0127 family)